VDGLLLIILAVVVTAILANLAFALGEDSRDGFTRGDRGFVS
jgi:hypothetical protein